MDDIDLDKAVNQSLDLAEQIRNLCVKQGNPVAAAVALSLNFHEACAHFPDQDNARKFFTDYAAAMFGMPADVTGN